MKPLHLCAPMHFTQEHEEIRCNPKRFIEAEISPHVDEWEAAEQFPAHEVFGKLGKLGLLGRFALSICKDGDARTVRPVQFGVARP